MMIGFKVKEIKNKSKEQSNNCDLLIEKIDFYIEKSVFLYKGVKFFLKKRLWSN